MGVDAEVVEEMLEDEEEDEEEREEEPDTESKTRTPHKDVGNYDTRKLEPRETRRPENQETRRPRKNKTRKQPQKKIRDETKRRPGKPGKGNQENGKGTRKAENLGKTMPNTRPKRASFRVL